MSNEGDFKFEHFHIHGLSSEVAVAQRVEGVAEGCTGLRVWSCGLLLATELAKAPELVRGRTTVELGCGCGIVGVVAALLGAYVVLTDRDPECMELAAATCEANATAIKAAGGTVECACLDWEWPLLAMKDVPSVFGATDITIASDPLYTSDSTKAFPRAAKTLLAPGGTLLCVAGVRKSAGGRETVAEFLSAALLAGLEMLGDEESVDPSTEVLAVAKTYWTDDEIADSGSDSGYVRFEFQKPEG